MIDTRVAGRYAKSLVQLAIEKNTLDEIYGNMSHIEETCQQSKELQLLLKSPIVKTDKKVAIISSIFEGVISEITLSFVKILATKKREAYLEAIASEFIKQYKRHKGIRSAVVTSAVPITPEVKTKLAGMLKRESDMSVEIAEEVDKDLIGGFIFRMDDQQIDLSIRSRLAKARKEMLHGAN